MGAVRGLSVVAAPALCLDCQLLQPCNMNLESLYLEIVQKKKNLMLDEKSSYSQGLRARVAPKSSW